MFTYRPRFLSAAFSGLAQAVTPVTSSAFVSMYSVTHYRGWRVRVAPTFRLDMAALQQIGYGVRRPDERLASGSPPSSTNECSGGY